MIWSGLMILTGIVLSLLDVVNADMLNVLIPPKYQPFTPLLLSLIGAITGLLRMVTTTPLGRRTEDQ